MNTASTGVERVKVAVIGAGISGLSVGWALRNAGIDDFVLLEEADEIGGTWRDNTYPGCACDVPSLLYSFSWAPNPGWSRYFAEREEIQRYIRDVTEREGLDRKVRLNAHVEAADWDEEACRWRVETSAGSFDAQYLVAGAGPWHEPVIPDFPGLGDFTGAIFHSSRWDHSHDLTGERIAVIGSGASAVQFLPEIQPQAGHVTLFQRTPHWVLPKPDRKLGGLERRIMRLPGGQRAFRGVLYGFMEAFNAANHHDRVMREFQRLGEFNIRTGVKDPALRKMLTPDYRLGCKRILISNDWYPTLAKENVTVVPKAVRSVGERSVTDADGTEHETDTIILATGFHILELPTAKLIRGRDGRSLDETWAGSPRGYLGTSVSGFPNAFVMLGPNAGINTAAFVITEVQANHVVEAVKATERSGAAALDVRPGVQEAYNRRIEEGLKGKVWSAGNCRSYFVDRNGRNSFHFPGGTREFRRLTSTIDLGSYERLGTHEQVGAGAG